jgi:hypothetical protein
MSLIQHRLRRTSRLHSMAYERRFGQASDRHARAEASDMASVCAGGSRSGDADCLHAGLRPGFRSRCIR